VTCVEQLTLLNNLNAKGTFHSDHPAIAERTFDEYFTDFTEANVKDTAGMSKHRLKRHITPAITNFHLFREFFSRYRFRPLDCVIFSWVK